jgi:uncharacterized protein YjbI with pentapeptide repeats
MNDIKDYIYEDLRDADFSGRDLSLCDFSYAWMDRANLRNSRIHDSTFVCARLNKADLRGAYIKQTKFVGADLRRARLTGLYLYCEDFTCTDLRYADLEGAYLANASFRSASFYGANLRGAIMDNADFKKAHLEGADLKNTRCWGTDFRRASFEGALLTGASLRGALLEDSNIEKANLSEIWLDLDDILEQIEAEVPVVLDALRDGRIDGGIEEGECCSLVGTIARARGVSYRDLRKNLRPQESWHWFHAIVAGDTPETSPIVKLTVEHIEGWLASRDASRGENQ